MLSIPQQNIVFFLNRKDQIVIRSSGLVYWDFLERYGGIYQYYLSFTDHEDPTLCTGM